MYMFVNKKHNINIIILIKITLIHSDERVHKRLRSIVHLVCSSSTNV